MNKKLVLKMSTTASKIAETLGLDEKELINKSLKEFLEHELIACESEISKLKIKYNVKSAKDMEKKYEKGKLDEASSWEDFFRLDHLEARKKDLCKALEEL
jgi:hypothetical protein